MIIDKYCSSLLIFFLYKTSPIIVIFDADKAASCNKERGLTKSRLFFFEKVLAFLYIIMAVSRYETCLNDCKDLY